jgi:uncharacterized membrane protein
MLLFLVLTALTFSGQDIFANSDLSVYTTNTKVSISPGESVDYKIDITNNGQETKICDISITGIPRSWTYSVKSGAYSVQQISILPGEMKQLSLKVEVPLKVNKGNYHIKVNAGGILLPLVINVSQQGSYVTEFTSDQANMEGHSKTTFTFRTKLLNRTAEKQMYSLQSDLPRGWRIAFKPNNQPATSVDVEPNSTTRISIEITPPQNISAGTYKIPVSAVNNLTSADLELEVVISGTFDMVLTTPTGLVSTKITAGDEKNVEFVISNTGTVALSRIRIGSTKPSGWEVTFEPSEIATIEPGQNALITATIKADKKAIAGDYVTNITARCSEVTSQLSFRVAVKTPMLWGWIGILIIILALGSIILLFRKYGRR